MSGQMTQKGWNVRKFSMLRSALSCAVSIPLPMSQAAKDDMFTATPVPHLSQTFKHLLGHLASRTNSLSWRTSPSDHPHSSGSERIDIRPARTTSLSLSTSSGDHLRDWGLEIAPVSGILLRWRACSVSSFHRGVVSWTGFQQSWSPLCVLLFMYLL